MTETGEIDIAHLLRMSGDDRALAEEILDIFRAQSESWGRMLDPAAAPTQWADAAHTLKGAALSIGAHEFAETCGAVERYGRSGEIDEIDVSLRLSSLKAELAQTLEACARASHKLSRPVLKE